MAVAPEPIELTVVVNGADECGRIAGLIGDHYKAIGVLYGELAGIRERYEKERIEKVQSEEWACPNCFPGSSPNKGPESCHRCGTPSPWEVVHGSLEKRDQSHRRGG